MNKKLKSRFAIHLSDLLCAGCSLLLGYLTSPVSFVLTFLFISGSYLRSQREAGISVFFLLACALYRGVFPAYSYALGLACFFVLVHMLKLWNQNVYQWLPWIILLLSAAFSVQSYGLQETAWILPIVAFILMQRLFQEYQWMQKGILTSACMRGVLLFGTGLFAAMFFPQYAKQIFMITMLLVALLSEIQTCAILALGMYLLVYSDILPTLVLCVLLSMFKENRKNAVLFLLAAFFVYPQGMEDIIFLLLCMSGVLLVPNEQEKPLSTMNHTLPEVSISSNSLLKRQMQNYSNIFQSLSDYYAQISDVQAELLGNMASALQYNAEMIRKHDGYEKDSDRIRKALEGYQYDIRKLVMEEPREGYLQLHLDIGNIRRGEIRTTLLPLLEVLMHRNLMLSQVQSRRFLRGSFEIDICDDIPFTIDAYADSIKNSYTSSGDTFSIFKFRQSVICMISDGMGNGEKAAQSSRLITNIFQRMMVSGIPQDSAIRCINKLIQSDTYATLDVICFNRSQGVAYISKSAACPTFLLRNAQIYEISGSALPVGIISQMQPDCFQVDMKEGDEYLMVSDGIYQNEIYHWLKEREGKDVKADVEFFGELLRKTRRKDDSTIVLARVDEVAQPM